MKKRMKNSLLEKKILITSYFLQISFLMTMCLYARNPFNALTLSCVPLKDQCSIAVLQKDIILKLVSDFMAH